MSPRYNNQAGTAGGARSACSGYHIPCAHAVRYWLPFIAEMGVSARTFLEALVIFQRFAIFTCNLPFLIRMWMTLFSPDFISTFSTVRFAGSSPRMGGRVIE